MNQTCLASREPATLTLVQTESEHLKSPSPRSLTIWRMVDGKPGHESQSKGLVDALARRVQVSAYDLPAPGKLTAILGCLLGRFSPGKGLPDPDLILGAGHQTHFSLLAARRARGGKSVVLMRPSLPVAWFDFCLVPKHDNPPTAANVLPTLGVLNPVARSSDASDAQGLILVGGPSTHFDWDDRELPAQVVEQVKLHSDVNWILTTSRRTPPATESALTQLDIPNLKIVPFSETRPGWVAEHLNRSGAVLVSEDSVSMVFEAVTSGARVGLLSVPPKPGTSRVRRSVETLLSEKRAYRCRQGLRMDQADLERTPVAEADRSADWILELLFPR
ncbi:mitochondrial fission ELM1 family protein [Coraliomargarita parva]|uniref:mitochondrial fission ELM1 family protein n=1 Tax=Coraliomargarita parva TaxID=3014050 RepID=UPI0022B4C944|nr:mitochondrial fission ELM1 family protein [Coraliomargarita parva]